jgi:hypothetical protein
MAKLGIRAAGRAVGVSHSTIQRAVKRGELTLDAKGYLDTADLVRVGFTLKEDMHLCDPETPTQELAKVIAERDRLRLEVDAALAREQAALAREEAALAREQHLLELLEHTDLRVSVRTGRRSRKGFPPLWEKIQAYLRDHPEPQSPSTVQTALQLSHSPRYAMRRMFRAGLLKQPEPGKYVLPSAPWFI